MLKWIITSTSPLKEPLHCSVMHRGLLRTKDRGRDFDKQNWPAPVSLNHHETDGWMIKSRKTNKGIMKFEVMLEDSKSFCVLLFYLLWESWMTI